MEITYGRYTIRTLVLEGLQACAGKWVGHWMVYDRDFGRHAAAIGEGASDMASSFETATLLAQTAAIDFIQRIEGRGEMAL
jgi:hypothetical protein